MQQLCSPCQRSLGRGVIVSCFSRACLSSSLTSAESTTSAEDSHLCLYCRPAPPKFSRESNSKCVAAAGGDPAKPACRNLAAADSGLQIPPPSTSNGTRLINPTTAMAQTKSRQRQFADLQDRLVKGQFASCPWPPPASPTLLAALYRDS